MNILLVNPISLTSSRLCDFALNFFFGYVRRPRCNTILHFLVFFGRFPNGFSFTHINTIRNHNIPYTAFPIFIILIAFMTGKAIYYSMGAHPAELKTIITMKTMKIMKVLMKVASPLCKAIFEILVNQYFIFLLSSSSS